MDNAIFLLSMPGGAEWILVLALGSFLFIFPILAIFYYAQAKRLRRENKELLEKLLERNR